MSTTALDWSLRLPSPLYNLFSKLQPGSPFEIKPGHMTFRPQNPCRLPILFRAKATGLATVWEAHATQPCYHDRALAPLCHSPHLPSCPIIPQTLKILFCSLPHLFQAFVQGLQVTISARPPLATVFHISTPPHPPILQLSFFSFLPLFSSVFLGTF